MQRAVLLSLALVAAVLSAVGGTADAAGSTIDVTTTADVVDGGDGLCSLREAITSANLDLVSGAAIGECPAGTASAADLIRVQVPGTILLNGTQLPTITDDVAIEGNGINLNAQQQCTGLLLIALALVDQVCPAAVQNASRASFGLDTSLMSRPSLIALFAQRSHDAIAR